MISAEVIKGVEQLLQERGGRQGPNERFGDFVARELGIPPNQAEILLASLHDGNSVEQATRAAGIDPAALNQDLLVQVARAIGSALGRIAPGQ